MMDMKVSKDNQNTSADGLIKRTSLMSDEIVSKTVHKDKENDQKRKKK